MVRTIKKAVSAVLALTVTMGTFVSGNIGIMQTYAADENTYINSKYIKVFDSDGDDDYRVYSDNLLLINGVSTYSKVSNSNLNDVTRWNEEFSTIELKTDAKLTFVDKYGNKNIINNKNNDGTTKYDRIYSTITKLFYKYTIVGKGDKISAINSNGECVKIDNQEWYDRLDVYMVGGDIKAGRYEKKGDICYGVYYKQQDETYIYKVIKEDGSLFFEDTNVIDVEEIRDNNQYMYGITYLLIKHKDGTFTLVDAKGKVWYRNADGLTGYDKPEKSGTGRTWIALNFGDYSEYIDYKNGTQKIVKGVLQCENRGGIVAFWSIYDGGLTCYDSDMNERFSIEGDYLSADEYYDDEYNFAGLKLTYKDGTNNICDKNGRLFLDKGMKLINDNSLYNAGYYKFIDNYETDNEKQYLVTKDGNIVIDLEKTRQLADESISSLDGCVISKVEVNYYNSGILYRYVLNNTKGKGNVYRTVIVTKQSNYTNAVVFPAKEGVESSEGIYYEPYIDYLYNGYLYIYRTAKGTKINLANGTEVTVSDLLIHYYDLNEDNVNEIIMDKQLYRSSNYRNLYSSDGYQYIISQNGIIKKDDTEEENKQYSYRFDIGDTGAYYEEIERKSNDKRLYNSYNSLGEKVDIGLKELYDDDSVTYIGLNSFNGYLMLNFKKDGKIIKKVYTYNYELVAENFEINYYDSTEFNGMYVYLINGKIILLKNILNSKLSNAIRKSNVKTDILAETNTQIMSGISDNITVNTVKDMFNTDNIELRNDTGELLSENSKVGTGCIINLLRDGKVVDTATVVVKGDTDGSGTIDVLDMEAVQKSILGIGEGLSGAYNEAARLTGNDTLSVLDMEAIQKDILGLEKIN